MGGLVVAREDSGYVPALDGIRALAVTAVLMFHGGVRWLPGGFLGVDAFFVLSGYLITTLLLREWKRTAGIALAAFWSRRIRRLLPALLLVVLAVAVGGRYLLPPTELQVLRGDSWAALFYLANWRMLLGGGDYFAQTAAPSPLQHTWSLSIEEQFYVALPLLLMVVLAGRRPTRRLIILSTGLAAASAVALGALYRTDDPGRAYYGTDTRAASLLIGVALAAVLTPLGRAAPRVTGRAGRGALALLATLGAGTTLWAWTHLAGDDDRLYHGGMVLCALAMATVIAHVVLVPGGLSARVLSLVPLVALGRISYGVYLWHWPLFLAANAERTGQHGIRLLALRCLLTVGVATLSYLLVERPVRHGAVLGRAALALPAGAVGAIVTAALVTAVTAVPTRPPASFAVAGKEQVDVTRTVPTTPRGLESGVTASPATRSRAAAAHRRRPGEAVRLDVFGDSVAWSLVTYLPRQPGLDVRDHTILGCGITRTAPYRYFGRTYPRLMPVCRRWPRLWRRAVAADNPDIAMILVGRWETMDRMMDGRWRHIGDPAYDAALETELRRAISVTRSRGAHVVLATEPYNRRGEQPDGSLYPEDHPSRVTAWNRLLRRVADEEDGVTVLDFGRRVSPKGYYTATAGGVQIRADGLHLTPEGVAYWIAPWLVPRLLAAVPDAE